MLCNFQTQPENLIFCRAENICNLRKQELLCLVTFRETATFIPILL